MRKYLIFFLAGFIIAASFTSCKSREKCPAYGQTAVKNTSRPA